MQKKIVIHQSCIERICGTNVTSDGRHLKNLF